MDIEIDVTLSTEKIRSNDILIPMRDSWFPNVTLQGLEKWLIQGVGAGKVQDEGLRSLDRG